MKDFEKIGRNGEIEDRELDHILGARRMRSIDEVLEEVEMLVDTHFDEFSGNKKLIVSEKRSSRTNQGSIEMRLLKT